MLKAVVCMIVVCADVELHCIIPRPHLYELEKMFKMHWYGYVEGNAT